MQWALRVLLPVVLLLADLSPAEGGRTPPKRTRKATSMMRITKQGFVKQVMRGKPRTVPSMPDDRCSRVGQFLTIPGELCKFQVCDYGHEPWRDAYGNVKLFTVEMPCAPGTFVQGQSQGPNPCNGHNSKMCLPKSTSRPKMMRRPAKKPRLSYPPQMDNVVQMMEAQTRGMQSMGYAQVMQMMKQLGKMMQSQMYTVMMLAPRTPDEQEDVQVMKEEVGHVSSKASSVMKGEQDMSTQEMKDLCIQMMDLMMDMVELRADMEQGHAGYGSTQQAQKEQQQQQQQQMSYGASPAQRPLQDYRHMMVVIPMVDQTTSALAPYPQPAEPEQKPEMPQGYGTGGKMQQMKKMMRMMESVMEMAKNGYAVSKPDPLPMEPEAPGYPGYGWDDEDVPTPAEDVMMMVEMPQRGYGQMQQKPAKMMTIKMMREMMTSGYRQQDKPMPSIRIHKMRKMRKMHRTQPKPATMQSGYGQMQMEDVPMGAYGSETRSGARGTTGRMVYMLVPETGSNMQMMSGGNSKSSSWD